MTDDYDSKADAIGSWEGAIAELRRRHIEEHGEDDAGNWRSIGDLVASVVIATAKRFTDGDAA